MPNQPYLPIRHLARRRWPSAQIHTRSRMQTVLLSRDLIRFSERSRTEFVEKVLLQFFEKLDVDPVILDWTRVVIPASASSEDIIKAVLTRLMEMKKLERVAVIDEQGGFNVRYNLFLPLNRCRYSFPTYPERVPNP